jgi:hypothetical protein
MHWKSSVVAVVVSLLLAACGTTTTTKNTASVKLTKVVVEWDGSGFSRFASLYQEEVTAVMQELAAREDQVLTCVLDGQPITTANITTTDFGASLQKEEVEKEEESETKQAIAAGLAKTLMTHAKEIVPGSGQLQGLEMATNTPDVSRIYQWTDGIVNEPDNHFSLTSATESQITAEIRQWQPRLTGLKGKTVVIVGVGRGVNQVITVERAHRLFRALVEGNGGHLIWTPTVEQQ